MGDHQHDHHEHDHREHSHGEHSHGDFGEGATELLDLDGEALHQYWSDALGLVQSLAPANTARLLDLGAGTGVGTIGLIQRFPDAQITALDIEDSSLHRIREKSLELGLSDQVHALNANLDDGLPHLEPVDVTWASMSLHHFGDPESILRQVFEITNPGGIVALAEFDEPVRVLPESSSEDRWMATLRDDHRAALPHLGAEWAPRITAAGFDLVEQHDFAIRVAEPNQAARRYAQLWLQRMLGRLSEKIDTADLEELNRVIADDGPDSVLVRDDLDIRGVRTVLVGRRPA